jgi:hypothetical protein
MSRKSNEMNANRIERLNEEMFAPRKNYVKPLVIAAIVILLLLAGAVKFAHAMSDNRSNGCHTYNVGGIFGGQDNTEAVFCGNSQRAPKTAKNHHASQNVTSQAVTVETSTTHEDTTPPTGNDTPSNGDNSHEDMSKVKHPNSGRGNGSEIVDGVDVDPGNSDKNNGGD